MASPFATIFYRGGAEVAENVFIISKKFLTRRSPRLCGEILRIFFSRPSPFAKRGTFYRQSAFTQSWLSIAA
jgi:hypothetical protein